MVVVLSSGTERDAGRTRAARPRRRSRVALDNAKFALTGGGELAAGAYRLDTGSARCPRGRARGFPLRLVWRDRAAGIAARAPLKLGADWSLGAALTGDETLDGRVSLFRESGDVVVSGEGRVVLAITKRARRPISAAARPACRRASPARTSARRVPA
jgi:translocation and assembly module TamB